MFNLVFGLIMLCCGGFFFIGAVKDSDFVFENGKPAAIAKIFGRSAARGIFGGLGGFCALGGLALLLSWMS